MERLAGTLEVDTVVENPVPKCTPWLQITPAGTGNLFRAQVDIRYARKPDGKFWRFARCDAGHSVILSGTLGQNLDVRAPLDNLDDVLLRWRCWVTARHRAYAPARSHEARRSGGSRHGKRNLKEPAIRGQATVANASIEGHAFDRFSADVTASRHSVALQHLTVSRGPTEITGDAAVVAITPRRHLPGWPLAAH